MGFKIEVDEKPLAGPAFIPGQKIAGRVIYISSKAKQISNVSILFEGKLWTEVKRRRGQKSNKYREIIDLFKLSKTLFEGQEKLARDVHLEWPFEFTAPEASMHSRSNSLTKGPMFAAGGACPLPPSFRRETGSIGKHGIGYVAYKLKVVVNSGSRFGSKHIDHPLTFVNVSSVPLLQPIPTSFEYKPKHWRSRSLCESETSFSQRMHYVLTRNPDFRTPSIAFTVALLVPWAFGLDQVGSLKIAVNRHKLDAKNPSSVTLQLESLELKFNGITNLLVTRSSSPNLEDEGQGPSTILPYNFQPAKTLKLDGTPVLLDDQFAIPGGQNGIYTLVPDFKTYTISHQHVMKAKAVVRHVESGHKFKIKQVFPFVVLPPHLQTQEPEAQETEMIARFSGES